MMKGIVKSPDCLGERGKQVNSVQAGKQVEEPGTGELGCPVEGAPPTLRGRAWVCLSGLIGRFFLLLH